MATGSIDTKRDKNGRPTKFVARYTVEVRGVEMSRSRTFYEKKTAEAFLATTGAAKTAGTMVDPVLGKKLTGEYVREWMALQAWRGNSYVSKETMWRLHIGPTLDAKPLVAVRKSDLQAVLKNAELASSSKVNLRALMGQVFLAAVEDRLITWSPAGKLKIEAGAVDKARKLEDDELARLLDEVPRRQQAMVELTARIGLRLGEAGGLKVENVPLLKRRLIVATQVITPKSGNDRKPYVSELLKGDRSYRTIPLSDDVVSLIAAHLAEYGPGVDGTVFSAEGGVLMGHNRIGKMMSDAAGRAGVVATFHMLRHTAASRFLSGGLSVPATAELMGHSAAVLLTTYAHFMKADEDRAREIMSKAV